MLSPITYKTLDRLRCDSCNSFLSCALTTTDGQRMFCGRCLRLTHQLYIYDKIAGFFIFPCRYWSKHCTDGNRFNEIIKHESSCIKRNGCINFCTNPISVCRSERQMSTTPSKFELVRINPDILNALGKCQNCNGSITSSPIYSNKDHIICFRCSYENLHNYVRVLPLEILFSEFLFPCNFKEWGCADYHRFGKENEMHEQQCLYRPSPPRKQRQRSAAKADADGKIRGIIQNHRGATWGTISPNHQVFVKETETARRGNEGLMVPSRRDETVEQAMFHNEIRQNQQHRLNNGRRDSDSSQISRTPSYLRNSNVPDVHRQISIDKHQTRSSYIDESQKSDTSSINDRMMMEMRESVTNDKYPSQLGVPIMKRYYDTNYNKVLQEFNYRKQRSKEVNN